MPQRLASAESAPPANPDFVMLLSILLSAFAAAPLPLSAPAQEVPIVAGSQGRALAPQSGRPSPIGLGDQGQPNPSPAGLPAAQEDGAQDGSSQGAGETQSPGPQRGPRDLPNLPTRDSKPLLAVDGQPVAPGRIPEGTAEAAIALWNQMLAANKSSQATGPVQPIQSFDMTFSARFRSASNQPESDVDVRFLFLEQGRGFLKAVLASGRQTLRGPDGDWLYDKDTWTQIQGREDLESVRELDRWVAISRNFVALTQARGIRLVELRALEPIPKDPQTLRIDFAGEQQHAGRFVILPNATLQPVAQNLRWLEVTSPDFGLYDSGEPAGHAPKETKVFRGALGLDPAGRVVLAQFHEVRGGHNFPQGALFVHIPKWTEQPSGYVLPRQLLVFRQTSPLQFEPHPNMDLWLKAKHSSINPVALTAAAFERPVSSGR